MLLERISLGIVGFWGRIERLMGSEGVLAKEGVVKDIS